MRIKRHAISFLSKARRNLKNISSSIFISIRNLPYISYKIMLEMEKRKIKESYVDFNKYAQLRRILHEQKFKMNNADYGTVRINWELFGEIMEERTNRNNYSEKFKYKSIQSTYPSQIV